MSGTQAQSFADLLRQQRLSAGLTQEALADCARMSLAAIGALERGARQHPYRSTIALLAEALSLLPKIASRWNGQRSAFGSCRSPTTWRFEIFPSIYRVSLGESPTILASEA